MYRLLPQVVVATLTFFIGGNPGLAADTPLVRAETHAGRPEVRLLGWDTEGGRRAETNLLRSGKPMGLRVKVDGQWKQSTEFPASPEPAPAKSTSCRLSITPKASLLWNSTLASDSLTMTFYQQGPDASQVESVELVFPFDPGVTPVTVLPSQWADDGTLRLPAVISAPDFGQMLLADNRNRRLKARLEGSRSNKTVDLVVGLPSLRPGEACVLSLSPVRLPAPKGLVDQAIWEKVRRGWFGALQPSAQWGEQNRPFSAPAGILANNVISDPASCSLWFYADQALWTPQITPDISVAALVRRSIDWWLDHRTRSTGEVVCYWDYGNFLDANAGPLIAAWDYVEATGDRPWLARRIDRLELIAEFLAKRDVDGDGMVEATQNGNRGTLKQPGRSCAWFDALNCGHKDGYTNALIYRAWRCLAELEGRLGRSERQARYDRLADRLKAAYVKTLYNPATGWLAWWKSADGELHDYATPIVNGLAIEYGLVEPPQGREILERLWTKIDQVGFHRFDLGIPPMLVPVRRSDYLLPDGLGIPKREDGTDTFGHYQNGGITAGQVLHFLAAHYVVGQPEKADKVLRAMLQRQAEGKFQNGVRDAGGQGIDWTDWNGNPTGYEGYLADSYRFLQAVLLREPSFRARYYRPLVNQERAVTALPVFRHRGVVLDYKDLKYNPCNDVIIPSVIRTDDLQKPLGRYHMYYAPHNAPGGICLAYADAPEGPWKEYEANPLIARDWPPHYKVSHVSGPHAIWIEEEKKLFVYYHGENDTTRMASTTDGIRFQHEGVAVTTKMFDAISEASYARVFRYTLPGKDNRYIMLLMGNNRGTRRIYLAWSKDGRTWEPRRTPLLDPPAGTNQIAQAWYFPWRGEHYLIFHGHLADSFQTANLYAAEIDPAFERPTHLGLFYDHASAAPDNVAQMSPSFLTHDDTIYMYTNIGPRLNQRIALAVAEVGAPGPRRQPSPLGTK